MTLLPQNPDRTCLVRKKKRKGVTEFIATFKFPRLGGCQGSAMIMITVAVVALFAFAILAIDAAILMTTKTQLQNAADAACLAAASGMGEGSESLATERAITYASYNFAVQDSLSPVVITPADVTFPEANTVKVVTHRTVATGDPLRNYFLRIVSLALLKTTDVTASATAKIGQVCFSDCIKPWAVPDRWDDLNEDGKYDYAEPWTDLDSNGVWNTGEPWKDLNFNGVYDPDEPYDPIGTGFLPATDIGVQIVLKVGNPQQSIASGHFFPVDFPALGGEENPISGGDQYREWIAICAPYIIGIGDSLQLEPGNMVGPTVQGVQELIDMDPTAYWDSENNTIAGSAWGLSPRAIKVVFFDPTFPPKSGKNYVFVAKIGAFFLETIQPGNEIIARFTLITSPGAPCPPGAPPSFIKGIYLSG